MAIAHYNYCHNKTASITGHRIDCVMALVGHHCALRSTLIIPNANIYLLSFTLIIIIFDLFPGQIDEGRQIQQIQSAHLGRLLLFFFCYFSFFFVH